ncbi:MAG: alkaline phosphatase family protein [Syntrophobacterales bacterium]|nr:MAG: alkaline phosphatase family protein [Syntrophobacterales bacterium]
MAEKVLILGLDCAPPELVFDRWAGDLKNLGSLMEKGIYGELESTIPPITVPAWTSMMTGKSPGTLGFYGFRNRANYSYDGMLFANSLYVKEDTVWDVLSRERKRSVVIGVPQTYPPKPLNGCLITSFLTPDTTCQYTYPPELRGEVEALVGEYLIDVDNFRTDEKDHLLRQIYEMTERRFRVAKHLMTTQRWDFFIVVEIGLDRIHHGFWKFFDKGHRKYQPGSKYEGVIKDYYLYLDQQVGEILSMAGKDTAIIAVSDHGAKRMEGGICINEWLMEKGYLILEERPREMVPLSNVKIDWDRTTAWGEGGYYCRLFLNVKGREPKGTIERSRYDEVREMLKRELEDLTDDKGNHIGTRVFKPEEIYPVVKGVAPDLIVYFGNLRWRSVGSVGIGSIHTFENDTGPDDANHSQHGIFIMKAPGIKTRGKASGLHIMDVAPTVLHLLGLRIPEDMEGQAIEG